MFVYSKTVPIVDISLIISSIGCPRGGAQWLSGRVLDLRNRYQKTDHKQCIIKTGNGPDKHHHKQARCSRYVMTDSLNS